MSNCLRVGVEVRSHVDLLPASLQTEVFMLCSHQDLALRVSLVCKGWNRSLNDKFWDRLYRQNMSKLPFVRLQRGIKPPFINIANMVMQHLRREGLSCVESEPSNNVNRKQILIRDKFPGRSDLTLNYRYTSDETRRDDPFTFMQANQLKRTSELEFSCELVATAGSGVEQKEDKELTELSQQITVKVNSYLAKKMNALVTANLQTFASLELIDLEDLFYFVDEGTLMGKGADRDPGKPYCVYIPVGGRNTRLTQCNRYRISEYENDRGMTLLALFRDVVSNKTIHGCKAPGF